MNEEATSVSRITTPFSPSKLWFFVAGFALVLLPGAVLPLWATVGWSWFLATFILYGIVFSYVIARCPRPLPMLRACLSYSPMLGLIIFGLGGRV